MRGKNHTALREVRPVRQIRQKTVTQARHNRHSLGEPRMPNDRQFPARLAEGYREFLIGRMPIERDRFRELARRGQSPAIMVIGCCDSRVSPEVIFDAHPGELFVVRNIANLVPAYTSDGPCHGVFAALEFAVNMLKVQHIVVLGHAHCGGIRAFVEHGPPLSAGDSVHRWMSMIAPAAELAGSPQGDDYLTRMEQAAITVSLANLMTFPYVADAVTRGALALHGVYFDVSNGQVFVRNGNAYVDIAELATAPITAC
jgi:carbonic anhydrase